MQSHLDRVEALRTRLNALAADRQELRAGRAPKPQLERNRRHIVRLQQLLSLALVERYS
jgi:hypothetical protein